MENNFAIRNAVLFDGLGNPSYQADLVVNDGIIESIAVAGSTTKKNIPSIDANGLALAPGFIDAHSHSDNTVVNNPTADAKISQGVTTEIVGNCGSSSTIEKCNNWSNLSEYAQYLNSRKPTVNIAALAGHNSIRTMVMGYENRFATREEIKKMKDILVQALEQGAAGFASGLWYLPGRYSDMDEVVEIATALKGTGKPYVTHMRSEGDGILDALDEALTIAAAGDNRLQVSHIKASPKRNWHKIDDVIRMIENAQERGMTVYADRYPYIYSCTTLRMILPAPWDLIADVQKFLAEGDNMTIVADTLDKYNDIENDWKKVVITNSIEAHKQFCGLTLYEIAQKLNMTPGQATVKLLSEASPSAAYGKMSEDNMRRFLATPWVVAGSDASCVAFDYSAGRAHPRAFGTFPRFFQIARQFAPDEEVIRRMTSLTAEIFNIKKRGALIPGNFADMVLFEPDAYTCDFDFANPHSRAKGVKYVFVNGKLAFDNDDPTRRIQAGTFLPIPNKN